MPNVCPPHQRPSPHPTALMLWLSLALFAMPQLSRSQNAVPLNIGFKLTQGATGADSRTAWMAEAEAFRRQRQWLGAIERYQRVLTAEPGDSQAYHALVMTLSDNGNADRAWAMHQARPELFDIDERLRLGNERVALLARWGKGYAASEASTYDASKLALAEAQALRAILPQQPRDRSRRLDFDMLVILGQLERYPEVIALYRQLHAENADLPPYVLTTIGDALLAERGPEEAATVLERASTRNQEDFTARILLSYAYLESERFAPAYALLQRMRKEQPPWIQNPGARYAARNDRRYEVDRTYAAALAQGEYLPQAQRELEAFSRIGPTKADLQEALGAVYYRRGWPQRALERQRMATTLDPRNVDARVGQAGSLLELQQIADARKIRDDLVDARPRNIHVQRLDQHVDRHTGWQLAVRAERARSNVRDAATASASPLGSRDGGHALEVQSPLLGNRWRLTAGSAESWVDFDAVRVRDRRIGVGVRYTHDRLDLRIQATRPNDDWSDRTGVGAEATWRFNDALSADLLLRRVDPDASLQARRRGITGDRAAAGLTYAPSERTTWAGSIEHWRYSDRNRRDGLGARLDQRLATRPHFLLNAQVSASGSRGSREDAPYFNPSSDASLSIGLRADHLAWRRYERLFRQRLSIAAGPYWQHGFGTAVVPAVRYEHEWHFGLGSALVYGLNWSRPVYDGVREDRLGLDIGYFWGTNR